MQKALNVEVKASLRSSDIICDLDTHCFRGHHQLHNIFSKVQNQNSNNKNFFVKWSTYDRIH